MKLRTGSKAKRAILAVSASAMALAASFAVIPSSPAFALTTKCSGTYGTTVLFKVCVQQTGTTSAQAYVSVTGGSSYISGYLQLQSPPDGTPHNACSGKHYAPSTCYGQNVSAGHGGYQAIWKSSGGGSKGVHRQRP